MRLLSHIIALLVEDISDPFFSAVARIVEEEAHRHSYRIFYSSTGNDGAITKDLIKVYRDIPVDAFIIAPPPGIADDLDALLKDNIPAVLFDRYIPGLPASIVTVDNTNGSALAVEHLLEKGYQRIAFVTIDSGQTQMADRLSGYTASTQKFHLPDLILRIPFGAAPARVTYEIKTFLERWEPNAVVFATNYLTISGLRAITNLGLEIPHDIAVIGFDDSAYYALCSPSITAIAQPILAIAQTVIQCLIPFLSVRTGNLPEQKIVLPVELVVRQSTMPNACIYNRNQILPK